jgi:hypothetical protein
LAKSRASAVLKLWEDLRPFPSATGTQKKRHFPFTNHNSVILKLILQRQAPNATLPYP